MRKKCYKEDTFDGTLTAFPDAVVLRPVNPEEYAEFEEIKKYITMNKNIDLTKILKDCPKGFKLYTPLFGEVAFEGIGDSVVYPIVTSDISNYRKVTFTKEGYYHDNIYAECLLFPSAEQRDWSKFEAPWYKKERFDPKTLKPFDKVLVRDEDSHNWRCNLFSHIEMERPMFPYTTHGGQFSYCIPFNEDTACLVGTKDEAPEFYRYWEE